MAWNAEHNTCSLSSQRQGQSGGGGGGGGHPALPSFAVPDYSSPVSPSTESAGSTSGLSSLKVASLGSQAVQKLFSVPVHVATQEAVLVQV